MRHLPGAQTPFQEGQEGGWEGTELAWAWSPANHCARCCGERLGRWGQGWGVIVGKQSGK